MTVRAIRFGVSITILALLLGSISTNLAVASTGVQTAESSAGAPCQAAIVQAYNAADKASAVSNAMNSPEYTRGVEGISNGTYLSTYEITKTTGNYPICTEEVLSYDVVFALFNRTGGWIAYLVISEDKNLSVVGSNLQNQRLVAVNHSHNWSGYEVQANSGATQAIYESASQFTQTSAGDPSTGCGSGNACNIGTWVGLADSRLGSNSHLDQAGTDVVCDVSGSTCTNSYFAFYELLNVGSGSAIICTASTGGSVNVRSGDSILAISENEATYGGSNSKYDFTIENQTNLTTCYSGGNSDTSMTSPVFADFIVENAKQTAGGYYMPLASFYSVPYSNSEIYTGSSLSYVNNFYWAAYDMQNQPSSFFGCTGSLVTNVSYGGMGSSGSFIMTYSTSQYTPVYATGC